MSFKLDHRWTKRGIKKCPKCGTENGQRSKRCKNPSCQHVPEASTSKTARAKASRPTNSGGHFVAVRLWHQDPSMQLFSVRKQGPGNLARGFVEIRDCFDSGGGGLNEDLVLQLKTGVCYVDCHPHTGPEGTCQHVRIASESTEVGEGLMIQREVLEQLTITADKRELIWKQQARCSPDSPLVQKVAEDTFVVRCEDQLHQLVPFYHVQLKQPESINCDCQAKETFDQTTSCNHAHIVAAAVLSSPNLRSTFESIVKHLLLPRIPKPQDEGIKLLDSMILVPDSFPSLEVADQFLVTTIENLPEPPSETPVSTSPIIELINSTENSTSIGEAFTSVYDEHDNIQLMECQIELMDQFMLTDRIDFCPSDIELSDVDNVAFPADEELGLVVDAAEPPKETAAEAKKANLVEVTTKKAALWQTSRVAKEKLKKGSYNVRRLMKVLESNGVVFNRIKRSEAVTMAAAGSVAEGGSIPSHEASLCGLTFTGWLESVIEQINSVIHYEGNGKPDTLVFSIHETFFQCLRSRFSVGHCLRMPDHCYELLEPRTRSGLTCQVYKFSCYKSLRHVFKTDTIALKFEKSFCRAADGSFTEIDLSDCDGSSKVGRPIRAHEFATYIKMGSYRREEDGKVHYFVIEWIAGVLPVSRFGELRISFEYGHRENRVHVEPPIATSGKDISALSKNALGCKNSHLG